MFQLFCNAIFLRGGHFSDKIFKELKQLWRIKMYDRGFFYIDFKAVPILRITFVLNHSAYKNQQRHRITICPVAHNNFEPITRCRVFYFIYGSWSCDLDIQLLDHVINHIIFNQTCVILELAFCLPFVGKKKKKECDRISRK